MLRLCCAPQAMTARLTKKRLRTSYITCVAPNNVNEKDLEYVSIAYVGSAAGDFGP